MSPVTQVLRAVVLSTALSVALLSSACTSSPASSAPEASGGGGAGGGSGLPSYWPEACTDPSAAPFTQTGCTDALAASCAALDSEGTCWARTFPFTNGYWALCEWAEFHRFADLSSCTTDVVSSKCVAATGVDDNFNGHPDPYLCSVTTGGFADWYVDDADQSLMKVSVEPISPSTSTSHYSPCFENLEPASSSPLCACTDCASP